jgi:hypothetical protein
MADPGPSCSIDEMAMRRFDTAPAGRPAGTE